MPLWAEKDGASHSIVISNSENINAELLIYDNIEYTFHMSKFAERLLQAIPGLEVCKTIIESYTRNKKNEW